MQNRKELCSCTLSKNAAEGDLLKQVTKRIVENMEEIVGKDVKAILTMRVKGAPE